MTLGDRCDLTARQRRPLGGAIAPPVKRRESAARPPPSAAPPKITLRDKLFGIQRELLKLEADRVRSCVARSQLRNSSIFLAKHGPRVLIVLPLNHGLEELTDSEQ